MTPNIPLATEAEYYGTFMSALLGLLDDAHLSAYSSEGIEHLTRAKDAFFREFEARHPGRWGEQADPLT